MQNRLANPMGISKRWYVDDVDGENTSLQIDTAL